MLRFLPALFAGFALTDVAASDTVCLHGKPPFRHVRILDFREGRVVFRGVSEQVLKKPLDEIAWFEIDDIAGLGAAERAAARENWSAAADGYAELLTSDHPAWLSELLRRRLLRAADRAGRFDHATAAYVALLRDGRADELPRPRQPGPVGSEVNRRARAHLRSALRSESPGARRDRLASLMLELLLYEGEPSKVLPEQGLRPGRASGSRPAPTTQAATTPLLGLDLGPREGARGPHLPVLLPTDTWLIDVTRAALDAGRGARAADLLEAARPHVGPECRAPWDLLRGRIRLEKGQYADAAAELLLLSETAESPDIAAEALYYVGVAHEGLDQPDIARAIYRELTRKAATPPAIRDAAAQAIDRLEREDE